MQFAKFFAKLSFVTVFWAVYVSPTLAEGPTSPPGAHDGTSHPPRRAPPAAAYDACVDAAEGDACDVELRDRTIDGTCVPDREDESVLFCRPNRPPGPPPEAFAACKDKNSGDSCDVTLGERTLHGTCAEPRKSDAGLVCMPEHPHDPPR